MKSKRNSLQLGCLALLLLWTLLGVILQLSGAWSNEAPGDDEGGGPFAVIGILRFIAFFLIFGIAALVRAVASSVRREPSVFPVEPAAPSENAEEPK